MTKAEKTQMIATLSEKLSSSDYFYITDFLSLTVEQVNKFRRLCFENDVEFKVVKNTLVRKAMEQHAEEKGFEALYDALKGSTALMFAETGNLPEKLLSEFRKDNEKPLLKAAYIDSAVFMGDDQLDTLKAIKSKEELIGDIIILLQSPAKNVIGSLSSAGSTLSGILKTLEEKAS